MQSAVQARPAGPNPHTSDMRAGRAWRCAADSSTLRMRPCSRQHARAAHRLAISAHDVDVQGVAGGVGDLPGRAKGVGQGGPGSGARRAQLHQLDCSHAAGTLQTRSPGSGPAKIVETGTCAHQCAEVQTLSADRGQGSSQLPPCDTAGRVSCMPAHRLAWGHTVTNRRSQPEGPLLLSTTTARLLGGTHCTRLYWMSILPEASGEICRRVRPQSLVMIHGNCRCSLEACPTHRMRQRHEQSAAMLIRQLGGQSMQPVPTLL